MLWPAVRQEAGKPSWQGGGGLEVNSAIPAFFQVGVNEVGDEEEKEAVARHGDWPWHVALMKEVR